MLELIHMWCVTPKVFQMICEGNVSGRLLLHSLLHSLLHGVSV